MGLYSVRESQKSNNYIVFDGVAYVISEILTKLSRA